MRVVGFHAGGGSAATAAAALPGRGAEGRRRFRLEARRQAECGRKVHGHRRAAVGERVQEDAGPEGGGGGGRVAGQRRPAGGRGAGRQGRMAADDLARGREFPPRGGVGLEELERGAPDQQDRGGGILRLVAGGVFGDVFGQRTHLRNVLAVASS